LSRERGAADGRDDETSGRAGLGRWLKIGAGLVLVAAALGAGLVLTSEDERPPPRPDIPLDAWAPYWALDSSLPELGTRLPFLREVSPFWFDAVGETEIVVAQHTPEQLAEEFIATVRASDAKLVPSIVDATASGEMAAILADPTRRSNHVDTLLAFARDGDYDGLDIDYEQFAFSDGRSTWATTGRTGSCSSSSWRPVSTPTAAR
jgi:hypothetical protein